jgi:dolichol-phosphate mannosyltransferase
MLSIIIPTFNERDNVFALAQRIKLVLGGIAYELIFVDDSQDDTPERLAELAVIDSSVRFIHRQHQRGLATAVVRGFEMARGDTFMVMDADLQHPPDLLIAMLDALETGADIVISSRFIPGGSDGGLGPLRKLISVTARFMATASLLALREVTDPTSGFFAVRRNVLEGVELRPIGWKILIEVVARGHVKRIVEIPYAFRARKAGESKMSFQEQFNYVRHLARLVLWTRRSPAAPSVEVIRLPPEAQRGLGPPEGWAA